MITPELKQLQQALDHKADQVQHDFAAVGEALRALVRRLFDARGDAEAAEQIMAEQAALAERQQALAAEVNVWRDRARAVQRQPDEDALRARLADLLAAGDASDLRDSVAAALHALDHPEEAALGRQQHNELATPAGRLLQRARAEYDLRTDPAARQRTAVEFANRTGLAQDDAALAELEAALNDPDDLARETVTLTFIQMHRFRALRMADLEAAHISVRRLARLSHPAVVPVLIEVLETARTGYVPGPDGMQAGDNMRSRLVALGALAERRGPLVQAAVRQCQRDRDPRMAAAAARALEVFPGEW